MALLDSYGKKISGPPLREVSVSGVRLRHSGYPSQGLTPERLALIFKEADAGDIARQAELFEEMEEKDAHLYSVLQTRKLAVAGLDWELAPASTDKEDGRIASFVKEALQHMNFDEAVIDLLDAVGKGFSVAELIWDVSASQAWITELRWLHQKMFTFIEIASPLARNDVIARSGATRQSDIPHILTDGSPVYGEELQPHKFVVHRYKARSGITTRGGVLRPCAYMYLFKNYAIKDWVIFAERYAMPMRIGKFNPATSEADRRVLKEAVFNLGSDAAAVISDSTVIELLEQSGKLESGALYERLCEFCDRSMSKAVLGQTLTTEQSGEKGTYATARIHQLVRQDLLEADAKALAKTIQTQVIGPLVAFNFGPVKRLPIFKFRHEPADDLKTLAETYGVLVREVGLKGIPEAHIKQKFGIPAEEVKRDES